MAHIADFMVHTSSTVGLNNYIARELSPHSPHDAATDVPASDDKEKYVWRMHQPTESRKYQLFPALEKLSMTAGRKSPDSESTSSMGQTGLLNGEKERSVPAGNALRKPKEQTLIRRRKVSVPELGPMTTVQEIAMDSPTIPGRPPLHERSISAPGNTWRQHVFGESMISCISGPALDEQAEMGISSGGTTPTTTQPNNNPSDRQNVISRSGSTSPKQPLSPKILAPLVIPTAQARINHHSSSSRLRNEFIRPEVPPKSAKPKETSPYPRSSPFTPMSSTTSLPLQNPTPHSAPEGRSSPKPWVSSTTSHSPSPLGHSRGQSDMSSIQRPGQQPSPNTLGHSRGQSDVPTSQAGSTQQQQLGHRRGESEGSFSVMDRGRPTRRPEINTAPIKHIISKRSPSVEEQKAFEFLPAGVRATDANTVLSPSEIDALRKQAIGQASRFEVLTSKDVEALSRELRGLDERCEYLRKTHRSLRSGRRNLHDRICSYLRSPRVARFSHDSILKQEEALSELDSSIDDWVTKLEQAENRRTRIRQKLLEHVAAALIMQPSPTTSDSKSSIAMAPSGENTPPRSPTKREAMSPQREMERVVEEVRVSSPEVMTRGGRDVESIRIYADSDVYALLADVEQEITRMGELSESDTRDRQGKEQQEKEREEKERIEKNKEVEKEDDMSAGMTLSAMSFEALPARTYTPPIPHGVSQLV